MVARPSRSQTTSLSLSESVGVRIPSNARWCLLVANPDIHQGTTGLVLAAAVLHTVAVVHLTRQQQSAGNGVALPGFCVHRGWGAVDSTSAGG